MDDIKLDRYHWHEALDRTHLCLETFERFVGEHPVITTNVKLQDLSNEIVMRMADLYQAIGDRTPND